MIRKQILLLILCFSLYPLLGRGQGEAPWTFWYWMYGAVSKDGIKADLKCMKDIGLGGCYLMPIRGTNDKGAPQNPPQGEKWAEALSPHFWEMVDYAFQQADSLGLQMGIHICDGFALAGGPWISPEESMQKVVYSDTIVVGQLSQLINQQGGLKLPRPQGYEGYYEDIATFAIPLKRKDSHPFPDQFDLQRDFKKVPLLKLSPTMTRNDKGIFTASEPAWIQFDFGTSRLFSNIEIAANGTNMQAQRMAVEVSDDGTNFRLVKQLVPPRQGWQNYDYNTTFAFTPTKARYWRLSWTPEGTEPGSEDLDAAKWRPRLGLKNAVFQSQPRIDNWEGKAGYVWRIAPEADTNELPDNICWKQQDIVQLVLEGDSVTNLALLSTDTPSTTYRIVRIGHTSTGYTNATAGGAKGLECDKFSSEAVSKQADSWFGLFKQRPHADVVKYLHVDSWECGSQNWSRNFAQEFKVRRGYDLIPWLPVMIGIPIESAAKSDQVLHDVRLTINELLHEVFFATVAQKARDYGVSLSSESVAPTMMSDGMEHYKYVDVPMGEYWLNSPTHDKPNDMLDAISGAHIYGKQLVQAEGFTEVRGVWDETPASIKPLLDRNFALGMNRLFFHVFTHNPWTDRRPGMTLDGIGLFFQRDQTWMLEAKGLVDYITRCQEFLQKGVPVADIAVFTGEEIPSRAVLPERLVPMLPGIFGKERVESEAKRLMNAGNPMEESPVGVHHSAGIVDTRNWVNALNGYQYDSMNRDVLLNLAKATDDGFIELPSGMRYRVLVIPMISGGKELSKEVRDKIEIFRKAGVIVVEQPYKEDDFSKFGLSRDVELPKDIAYTHRKDNEQDIYFLANQSDQKRTFRFSLREKANTLFLYDPMTGRYDAVLCDNIDGRNGADITLYPYGSLIIIRSNSFKESIELLPHEPDYNAERQDIIATWRIRFNNNGVTMSTDQLFDWSSSPRKEIKYYSGSVTYEAGFPLKVSSDNRVWIELNQVHDIAHVYVDGNDCGIAWTAPYRLEITQALKKKKEHQIKIVITNTWANALMGNDKGQAPFKDIWTNAKYRRKSDRLLPTGLLGPITLIVDK